MPTSILEAIRLGNWEFEPREVKASRYPSTKAVPGSRDKLEEMARRVENGLPLWHPDDREGYAEDLD